jgi:hypothetical protein
MPLGLLGHRPPGRHAARRQMQQRQLIPAGMDRGGREPLLGGQQCIVPRTGQVLSQSQIGVGAQAEGQGRAPAHHLQAGGHVAHRPAQVAGQKPEHPAERQAVHIDQIDARRIRIEVLKLGQRLARAGQLGGTDGDQGTCLAGRRRVQPARAQRPPPERLHLLPVSQDRVSASQTVGDLRGQRLAARASIERLRQRFAEQQPCLGELALRECHRAQYAAAQGRRCRRLHRLAQG